MAETTHGKGDPDLIAKWKAHQASLQTQPIDQSSRPSDVQRSLAELERYIMATDPPVEVLLDLALVRALLRYVRRLEHDTAKGKAEGSFW